MPDVSSLLPGFDAEAAQRLVDDVDALAASASSLAEVLVLILRCYYHLTCFFSVL